MTFDSSYFEDEVREGFYVPAMMKRNWAAQIEVLQMFSKFCEECDIQWFAAYGTLLGAVRHNGFIPWDDDVDVWMKRKDYEKFLRNVNMMPEDILFSEGRFGAKNRFDQAFGRISNIGLRMKAQENDDDLRIFMNRYHGYTSQAGIDIFVLDRLAPTEEEENIRRETAKMILYLIQHYDKDDEESQKNVADGLERLDRWLAEPLDRNQNLFQQLMIIFEALNAEFEDSGSTEITAMHDWLGSGRYHFKEEWFSDTVELPFENIKIKAPIGYKEVLSRWHSDYMVPRQETTHGYPCYRSYEQSMEDDGNPLPYLYRFQRADLYAPEKAERKGAIRQMLLLFQKMHSLMIQTMQSAQESILIQSLGTLQELTMKISMLLENSYLGESVKILNSLNLYHESLYQLYQKLTAPGDDNTLKEILHIVDMLNDLSGKIQRQIEDDIISPREVVFLPFKLSGWKKLKPLYEYYRKQSGTRVYVAPISYYHKNGMLQTIPEPVDDSRQIAEDVEIVPADQMPLAIHTPDLIFTQNTYDQYSTGLTVDSRFYSSELQKYAGKVIYVPWFSMDEVDLHHPAAMAICQDYINMPGVIHADKVLVSSYNMRHVYISKLTEFAGEDTWKRWENSVQVMDTAVLKQMLSDADSFTE